jgi:regulator of extracellular matrix RemA (YlzA/DUF370 family)
MARQMVNVGFGNAVAAWRVVAVVAADSAPVRRLIEAAEKDRRLVDATKGRKTRSVVITDSNHVLTSHLTCQKLAAKVGGVSLPEEPETPEGSGSGRAASTGGG